MESQNYKIMQQAWKSLKGKWHTALSVSGFILLVTIFTCIPIFGYLVIAIILAPLSLGETTFALKLAKNKHVSFSDVLAGFNNYVTSLWLYFLRLLLVLMWALLLIIPGIIVAHSYSMSFFILAENPDMQATEILAKSKKIMHGYKWELFYLNSRFIGWIILCILTLGIGFLWLIPYMQVSFANFYLELKKQHNLT